MKKTTLFVYAVAAWLLTGHATAFAQSQVEMTTSAAVGETFSFTVNRGASITVDWGDGNPVEVKTTEGAVSGVLKGPVVKIGGDALTLLNCNDAGLTALDVSGATQLTTLYCSGNELTELTLTKNTALTDLDCSYNQLTTLMTTGQKGLITLDCSDNQIATLSLRNSTKLKHLLCSNNKLALLTVSSLTNLETLWCDNNALSTLTIDANRRLQSVVCDNNQLTRIKMATIGHPDFVDFWCADNQLTSLSLNGSARIKTLNCENNQLTSATLCVLEEPALSVYMGNNRLDFTSFYSNRNVKNYFYAPQGLFPLSAEKVNLDEEVECPDMRKDGEGATAAPSYTWINEADNSKLSKGATKDFVAVSGKSWAFKFKKPFEAVHCLISSVNFPNITLQSTTLKVVDPLTDAIAQHTKQSGFTYHTSEGAIYMSSTQELPVAIYTLGGKLVWKGTVNGSGIRVPLGHGVFLVNHIKVAL